MKKIFLLLYTSKSVLPIEQSLLDSILTIARTKNSARQITGFLVAREGYYMQLLEGDELEVRSCFEKIRHDKRHTQIKIRGSAHIEMRIMPNWSMGQVAVSKNSSASELLEIFDLAAANDVYSDSKSLEALLRIFAKNVQIIG